MVDWLSLICLTIPRVMFVFAIFFLFFFSFFLSFPDVADVLSSSTVSILRFLCGVALSSVFCGFEGSSVDVGVWNGVEMSVLVRCSSLDEFICSTPHGSGSVDGGVTLVGSVPFCGEDIVSFCWLMSANRGSPETASI